MSSLLDRQLPDPSFIERDPDKVTREMVASYEQLAGKTLYPAQIERLQISVVSYRESLMREAIQDAAMLNLVRYSRAPMLDNLGENIGVARLSAVAAITTLTFTFDPVPAVAAVLPQGTQVSGGGMVFATDADVIVAAGAASVDATASCITPGADGNGYLAGQINQLVGAVVGLSVASVANTTTTADGAEDEDDDNYRERIVLAPGQFSTAGSIAAYKFFARSAHQSIKDVAISVADGGRITLYPLVDTGLPSDAIKAAVAAACTAEQVRPLSDTVLVDDPVQVDWRIGAQLVLYAGVAATPVLAQAVNAANAYYAARQQLLGVDIVRTQIIAALSVAGVYDVILSEPAADRVLEDHEWGNCTGVDISISDAVAG